MSVQVLNNYISDKESRTIINAMTPYIVGSDRPGMAEAQYEDSIKTLFKIYAGQSIFDKEEEHEAGLLYTQVVNKVGKEISEFYGVEAVPVSAIFAEVSKGGQNGLHCDSVMLDGTPWEDNNDNLKDLEFSALVYLNTSGVDYEGGQIEFPEQKITITPETGKLVFFRGDIDHPHQVFEVTAGKRYTLILFYGRAEQAYQYLQFKSEREFGGI